jgi:hypothetical protein
VSTSQESAPRNPRSEPGTHPPALFRLSNLVPSHNVKWKSKGIFVVDLSIDLMASNQSRDILFHILFFLFSKLGVDISESPKKKVVLFCFLLVLLSNIAVSFSMLVQ